MTVRSRMRAEIEQQPQALADTAAALVPTRPALRSLAEHIDRVVFFARGSSDNVAVYGRYLVEVVAGLPAALGAPSVATLYRGRQDLHRTLAVIVSQSGRTHEMVDVAQWAQASGAITLAVTNTAGSDLVAATELSLVTRAGDELAVPATKTFSTALLAVAVLAIELAGAPAELSRALGGVPEQAAAMLATDSDTERLATIVAGCPALYAVGRGFSLSTAVELALKVEETCRLTAVGMSWADLQHGPLAVLGAGPAVVVTAGPDGPTLPGLAELAATARRQGAPTIAIGGDAMLQAKCDDAVAGPRLPEPLAPIAAIVAAQLFTEHLARRLGRDPDFPTGLTKVTQTA